MTCVCVCEDDGVVGGITTYPLVEFEPGGEAFGVHVLQTKEPHLSQTNGLDNLREEYTDH